MLSFVWILTLPVFMLIHTRASPSPQNSIPACIFNGAYPNDTVLCKEYVESLTCTNAKECCEIPDPQKPGCFNMSVIQAYGLWTPPAPDPADDILSCSRKDFFISQHNNTDKAIDGHVLERYKALTLTQCGDFCLRLPRCRAFNLATVVDQEGTKDCELLENDTMVVERKEFSFWLFDRHSYEEKHDWKVGRTRNDVGTRATGILDATLCLRIGKKSQAL